MHCLIVLDVSLPFRDVHELSAIKGYPSNTSQYFNWIDNTAPREIQVMYGTPTAYVKNVRVSLVRNVCLLNLHGVALARKYVGEGTIWVLWVHRWVLGISTYTSLLCNKRRSYNIHTFIYIYTSCLLLFPYSSCYYFSIKDMYIPINFFIINKPPGSEGSEVVPHQKKQNNNCWYKLNASKKYMLAGLRGT